MSVSMVFRKTRNTFCFEICKRLEDSNYESATRPVLEAEQVRQSADGPTAFVFCICFQHAQLKKGW